MDKLRVLVVDPEATFGQFVVDAMRDSGWAPDLVVHQTSTLDASREGVPDGEQQYDLLVLGWDVAAGAIADLVTVRERFAHTAIVVSSSSDSLLAPRQALSAGAAGFFRRDSPAFLIRSTLDLVLGGEGFALPDHLRESTNGGTH